MKYVKITLLAALSVFVVAAYALQPVPQVAAQSSAALSIVPKKNYLVEPGDTVKDTLIIRNLDSNHELELTLRVIDFTYTADSGTPKLLLDEDAPQTTWSLKPFLTVPKTVTVPPSESKTLDMKLAIPEGHGAGSYYSAIIYSSGSPEGGNIGLNASGVTLVFASVPGKVHEDLKLEKFGPYREATASNPAGYMPYISLEEPRVIAYTLKNGGNVTEAPVGSITLRDMYGRETVISNVNPSKSLALIDQSRTFTACIKLQPQEVEFQGQETEAVTCSSPGLWPGLYTASLHLFYGQNGNTTKEVTGTMSFWYLPWWFILALLVVILLIVYIVRRTVLNVRERMHGRVRLNKSPRRR